METSGYRFSSPDGLLHVRAADEHSVVLRASCAEFAFSLERLDPSLENVIVRIWNLPPSAVLTLEGRLVPEVNEPPASARPEREPLAKQWRLAFAPGIDRLELVAPAQPAAPFTYAAFGDIQTGIGTFPDVVEKLNAEPELDAVVVLGDLTHATKESEFDAIEAAFATIRAPVWVTPGNHDTYTIDGFRRRFGRGNYTCRHRGAQLTSVDSSNGGLAPSVWSQLPAWLERGSRLPHVVFSHIPATEVMGVRAASWGSRREARQFSSDCSGAAVDLLLFGHIHSYDAYILSGIPTFIAGGGGALGEDLDGVGRHFLRVRQPIAAAPEVTLVRVDEQ